MPILERLCKDVCSCILVLLPACVSVRLVLRFAVVKFGKALVEVVL